MKNILVLSMLMLLTACATPPQKTIDLDEGYLQAGSKRVGVVLTKVPELDVYIAGADCLLCILAAEAANSSLSAHIETLAPDDFRLIESELVQKLTAKGVNVVAIDGGVDLKTLPELSSKEEGSTKYDYSQYREKYKITHLLVIDVDQMGMYRTYASYFPTSDPRAIVAGVSYLVDLSSNTYQWYKHINILKGVDGGWDEPPNFPALTNAYYQAIEEGREQILSEF